MRVYSLGPAGRGAIAGAALLSPLKSLVAPACGAGPGLGADGGFEAIPPEIICVNSPAGLGETGAGRAGATEPLNSCVNPPGADSAGGPIGGAAAGWSAIDGGLKSSVKPPPALEPEKGVGAAFALAAVGAGSVLNSSVNRPVPGWADKGDSGT